MLNFNTEPYNDDYNEDNKFYRILFRPSFAVQARELTQLQTILQKQVSRHGDAIFKQGAMVIPGQISIDTKFRYVKLTPSYGGVTTETYIQTTEGKYITGSSGLKAQIIKVVSATATDPTTIYVRYLNSGDDSITKTFSEGEVISVDGGANSFQAVALDATGVGSAATIQRGVYYVNGFFVLCANPVTGGAQSIILDKYSNTPSYRVGLTIVESTVVPEDDETLLDNAQTSYNFAAPGAHRYHIDLILAKKSLTDEDDENFIQLSQVNDGQLTRIVTKTEYSELEKTFARRTYDESGNYDIRPFTLDVREARNNNRGNWTTTPTSFLIGDIVSYGGNFYTAKTAGTSANSVPPTHTSGAVYDGAGNTGVKWEYTTNPEFNRGIKLDGDDNQLALALDPGKAYVQGYEIEKISTEYVYIDKCRGADHTVQVENSILPQTVGNYFLVNSIQSVPPVDTFDTVDLYNHITQEAAVALTGTMSVTLSGTSLSGTTTAFTTELIVGSVIYNSAGIYVGTITAIASNTAATITAAAVALSSAAAKKDGRGTPVGTKVGTARVRALEWHNGTIGTDAAVYKVMLYDIKMISGYNFTQNVKSIYYNNSAGGFTKDFSADIQPVTSRLIGSATASNSTTVTGTGTSFQTDLVSGDYIYLGTTICRVVSISSQSSLTVDRAVTVTGVTIDRITTEILEPNYEALLFPFPYYAIKTARAADSTNRITYTVYEKFTGTTSSGAGGNCTLTVSAPSGTMGSAAETDNYQLIDNTTGKTVAISPSNINPSGSSATFTLPDTYASRAFVIIGTVTKTLSANTEKTKTLTAATVTFTTQAAATANILNLGVADGFRIISVKQATGMAFGSSPASSDYVDDVSDFYTFDDGQTPTYYGLASLKLKPSFSPPNAPVQVVFEYFAHGTGDYFTVNSYTDIDYKKIPVFSGVPLRDFIDFRPRVDTTGIAYSGSGASLSLVPKRGTDIEADFQYYLSRSDKLALDFTGNFFSITGVPSLNPGLPQDPTLGMVLYEITLEPYTFNTSSTSVSVSKRENKRYTMRDIGKLEKRIDTLEYYTSLSMLEQQTQATQIVDPVTGLTRFKNGFIVDNFSGHAAGDVRSPDYFCSIDMENNHLRPFYSMKNINLIEKVSTNVARAASNYQITGDVITLPYNEQPELITQPYASRLENINPFAIFTFLGTVNITPSSDDWFEVDRRPDIIQNEEGDFNTISVLAEKAGVLGTVWNAWQTQWSGATVQTQGRHFVGGDYAAYVSANVTHWGGWSLAGTYYVAETFATQVGQSRTGINTKVVAKIDKRQVEDKVLSTAVIPYIRSRNVLIQASGLKPSTKFNPFFDNVDISSYCTPATKITYSGTANFNYDINVGSNSTADARRISGDTQVCLNRGDVVTGQTSGATAVVVGTHKHFNDSGVVTERSIDVVNIIGTFQTGETIIGDVSSASATISTIGTVGTIGSDLITNESGEINMLFDIPQDDNLRFRTGQREFVLTDTTTATDFNYTSRGKANYYAQGILETKQATYVATRNGVLVQEQTAENRTIIQTSERVVAETGWYDPLAQTFLVKSPGGAFLTKVDVFFATKDLNIPVTMEIREVINGYPGKNVLPFSRVTLRPEFVNISTNEVDMPDGTKAKSYDTPTTFTFPSPVYVQDNQEYALVLASDSNGYKVWISNMGDKIPNSSRMISEQPYAGVLFKSQNGSTWTANQDQDLKFTIYRAKFDTTVVSDLEFVNDVNPIQMLDKDPFETNIGSNKVKVFQQYHGLTPNSYVTLSNTDSTAIYGVASSGGTITCSTGSTTVTGVSTAFTTDIGSGTTGAGTVLRKADGTYIGVVASVASDTTLTMVSNAALTIASGVPYYTVNPINGIPSTEVYKQQTVVAVIDHNSYIVNCTTNATNKGYSGSTTVTATQNAVYNSVQPIIQSQSFPDTTAVFLMKSTSGQSVDGSEVPYAIDSQFNGVIPNETNYFNTPRVIASEENQNQLMSGNPSASLLCQMSTTNDAVSPVIDTHRISLVAVSNIVNSATETNTNQSGLDDLALVSANTTIAFAAATNATVMSSANSTVQGLFATIQVGKYVTISGAADAANNGTFLVTAVNTTTGDVTLYNTGTTRSAASSTTVVLRNTFVGEISPQGSSTHSKYVTKRIGLNTPATNLKISLSVNIPSGADLQVYYKTSPVGTKETYTTINYTLANPDSALPKVEFGNEQFTDVDWSISSLTPFDSFTVKLVMKSTTSSAVPRLKDLRIIANS
jgi:hypothetical protein